MAEKSGFFDSTQTDPREYIASEYAEYFKMFFNSGVANVNGKVGLTIISSGTKAVIEPGFALINGYYYKNNSNKELQADPADNILNRIDRVVLKLDLTTRTINSYIKKGVFASTPIAPMLQRDNIIHEISLARLLINAKSTAFTVVDERFDETVCGQIAIAAKVPIQEMWNSFNSWFQGVQNQVGLKLMSGIGEPSDKKAGDIWLKEL